MNIHKLLLSLFLLLTIVSCTTVSKSGKDKVVPEMNVQLKINSLQATRIQEQGVLGIEDGDELTMLYSIHSYDSNGDLYAINTGFWGTRTHQQGALITTDEFDKIKVGVPKDGKIIATIALIEIDNYKGERRIIETKRYTNSVHYPKRADVTTYEKDKDRLPMELVANALDIAGFSNFIAKYMKVSSNDYLGGTKKTMEASDMTRIISGGKSGQETYQIDGGQVNENYLYELKYDLDVTRLSSVAQ